ncbi:MAG: hypothetical protein PHF00_02035 [Elusimicrobia bacterium]|nr:hypothetical protein [Elusimicrobiota bacterium]
MSLLAEGIRLGAGLLLILISARCVAADFRDKRILNRDLRLAASAAGVLYGVLALRAWWGEAFPAVGALAGPYPDGFLGGCLNCVAAACGLALLLWLARIWPAGDAKLFMILALFLPLIRPGGLPVGARLPLSFLVNIFVPAAAVVLVKAFVWLWLTRLRHGWAFHRELGRSRLAGYWLDMARNSALELARSARQRLREAARSPAAAVQAGLACLASAVFGAVVLAHLDRTMPWYRYLGPFLGVGIMMIWRWLKSLASQEALAGAIGIAAVFSLAAGGASFRDLFWRCLLSWSLFGILFEIGAFMLRRMARAQEGFSTFLAVLGFAAGLGVLPIIFPFFFTGLAKTMATWAFFGIMLGLGFALIRAVLEENVSYCPADHIHPRLVLAKAAWEDIRRDEAFYQENFRWRFPDGLTDKQAESLRRWCAGRSVAAVATRDTEPFAGWMVAGAGVTLLLAGRDVASCVVALLRRGAGG